RPVQIHPDRFGGGPVAHVAANGSSCAAATCGGDLYAWGFNETEQLGNGGTADENAPCRVTVAPGVPLPRAAGRGADGHGAYHMLGRVMCLGGQHAAALCIATLPDAGSGTNVPVPLPLPE